MWRLTNDDDHCGAYPVLVVNCLDIFEPLEFVQQASDLISCGYQNGTVLPNYPHQDDSKFLELSQLQKD
ncbi:hypothetical protein O181_052099 [Austropuccinia psidii MF-1]|uniref:Uncharacterized protein n=1 Tax=Austropuccinia psidii MF-1 TaxID=1389203 RepID=A0A9Q3E020_9BASI|nr:hypothetical protein [Austropuccinia psidii MF-1]